MAIAPDGFEVLPPVERPNESAGYLGYYCRIHLHRKFDLVDLDGLRPAIWLYYQANGRTLRFIEEKPHGQQIHPSQRRAFGSLGAVLAIGMDTGAYSSRSGIYVIWDAERLVDCSFPIELERHAPSRTGRVPFSRDDFDDWLLLTERKRGTA